MKKWVKYGFPITCIVVVGGTLIAVSNLKSKAEEIHNRKIENSYNFSVNTNTNTNISNVSNAQKVENKIENKIDNTVDNNVQNTNTIKEENKTANNTVSNTSSVVNNPLAPNTEETNKDLDKKDDKQKALEMVQKEWGEDSTVYYTNEKEENGLFIVAVRDKSNTAAKAFYKVDLKNKTVELDW